MSKQNLREEAVVALDFISDQFQTESREAKSDRDSDVRDAIKKISTALLAAPQEWQPKAIDLRWWENFDDLHRQEFVAYIMALPHSTGNHQARYTVRHDRFTNRWDCCFWVGNMGHPLVGGVFHKGTKEEAMQACQKDLNERVYMMIQPQNISKGDAG